MATITRPRLARGTKLVTNHVHGVLTSAATELAAGITADQLQEPSGTFRVNLHRPVLGGSFFLDTGDAGERGHVIFPFMLPPPQNTFAATGRVAPTTPTFILEELQLSFDQRNEPAAIRDVTTVADGNMDFANAATYDIRVALKEKLPRFFGGADNVPRTEVASWTFPRALWTGRRARINPIIITDLNLALHPYRTYCLFIDAADLAQAGGVDLALVSFVCSLKFRTQLVAPDTVAANNVQNAPSKHNLAKNPENVVITTPAAGSVIEADDAFGVQTSLELVDDAISRKLEGGISRYGNMPRRHALRDDACYEVIAVPMFPLEVAVSAANEARLPYIGLAPFTQDTCDRRVIPLAHPVVIQHVIAVTNWCQTPAAANLRPSNANLIHEVGVGLGHGFRSDNYLYQEVAYATWQEREASRANNLIDEVKERDGGQLSLPQAGERDADFALMHVPLVYQVGGAVGPSFYTQGPPVYAGRALYPDTTPRTNIASQVAGAMGAPATLGREQWLEARWRFGDNVNGLGSYAAGNCFVGQGGFMLYIYCKKVLADPSPLAEV